MPRDDDGNGADADVCPPHVHGAVLRLSAEQMQRLVGFEGGYATEQVRPACPSAVLAGRFRPQRCWSVRWGRANHPWWRSIGLIAACRAVA